MIPSLTVVVLFCAILCAANEPKLRLLTKFQMKKPAFVTTVTNPQKTSVKDLLISSFGVSFFGDRDPKHPTDGVYYIDNISEKVQKAALGDQVSFQPKLVGDTGITWPNEMSVLEDGTLLVAGGFLVPGKKGQISFLDYNGFRKGKSEAQTWRSIISDDKKGFFHRVEKLPVLPNFVEENKRFVSCRGYKGVFNQGGGEMIYFEPNSDGSYTEHEIAKGCDVFFVSVDLNGDGINEFILPEFFGRKLVLQWTEDPNGDWTQAHLVKQRVIDADLGAVFNADVVQLTDKGLQLLVTNHESNKAKVKPSLFALDIKLPTKLGLQDQQEQLVFGVSKVSQFMNSVKFEKHVLSSNFTVTSRMFNSAAPGGALVAYERINSSDVPSIVVSGDGTKKAYLLTPTSDLFKYKQSEFHDCAGTVGALSVQDLDQDGWNEVIVPCYDADYVAIYTFKPE